MNNVIQDKKVMWQSMDWIIAEISFVSIIIGLAVLAKGQNTIVILARAIVHNTLEPAIINFIVAISAFVVALLAAWRKLWHGAAILPRLIITVAVVGVVSSLLWREDYSGGTCGDFDWASGHLHAGYPYSWVDGHICVPHQFSLSEYTRQHPEKAGWFPDFPALLVDLVFWANIGILASSILGMTIELRKRLRYWPRKKNAA